MAWTNAGLMKLLDIPEETAEKIMAVARGETATESYSSVLRWVAKCYNVPSLTERKMMAFNEILEGHGVEGGCILNGDSADFSYVNMGDPYITTIVYDNGLGKFRLMAWGDFIEEVEKEE